MKLTKKQKAKWLKALRSGEYSQTRETLYDPETKGFCCLGVLQHCMSGGKVEYENEWDSCPLTAPSLAWYQSVGIKVDTVNHSGYPEDPSYDVTKDADEEMLMNMNDGNIFKGIKKKGFRGIAQWIERNVETID